MDVQIDKEGRVLVGSEDGCVGPCVQGGGNSFSSKGFISRQSGGKRLLAACEQDPALGYAVLKRFATLMAERLNAARLTAMRHYSG